MVEGLHVPEIPFTDVNGSTGAMELRQSEPNAVKVGVITGNTVISIVVDIAHCPASGVNEYVPLTVLLTTAGDQLPVIPLVDVVGNTGAKVPEQIAGTGSNVGVRIGLTVTVSVVVVAH